MYMSQGQWVQDREPVVLDHDTISNNNGGCADKDFYCVCAVH
jgi:hypothetical protein